MFDHSNSNGKEKTPLRKQKKMCHATTLDVFHEK